MNKYLTDTRVTNTTVDVDLRHWAFSCFNYDANNASFSESFNELPFRKIARSHQFCTRDQGVISLYRSRYREQNEIARQNEDYEKQKNCEREEQML